jgi:hypothetical protein
LHTATDQFAKRITRFVKNLERIFGAVIISRQLRFSDTQLHRYSFKGAIRVAELQASAASSDCPASYLFGSAALSHSDYKFTLAGGGIQSSDLRLQQHSSWMIKDRSPDQ